MQKEPFSFAKRIRSFRYALHGVKILVLREHNARIHLLATIVAVFLGFLLEISTTEWLFIVLAIALVWTAELLNTAIEYLADLITKEQHPTIGKVKDLAAGAVLIAAVAALAIGLFIFIPKILLIC